MNRQTLCSLCLDCIVNNFEIFMAAYDDGNVLQKEFLFLQIRYSDALLDQLLNSSNFEKHVKFLLNEHLTEICLSRKFEDITPVISRLKEIGSTIRSLDFSFVHFANNFLEELCPSLPNLEILDLSFSNISKNALLSIGNNCPSLKELSLSCCESVTDDWIKEFYSSHNNIGRTLQQLCIGGTKVSMEGIAFVIKNFKNLLSTRHENTFETIYNLHYENLKNNFSFNMKPYSLEEFIIEDLRTFPFEAIELCTSLCPNLKELDIGGINSQLQINTIAKLQKLKTVSISIEGCVDLWPFIESRGKNLEMLTISRGDVSIDMFLDYCPNLQCLSISFCNIITPRNFEFPSSKTGFNNLDHFHFIEANFLADSNLKFMECILSRSPNLYLLHLDNSKGFTDAFVQSITSYHCINNIKEIDIDATDIEFSNVEILIKKTPNLKKLSIQSVVNLLPEDVEKLQELKYPSIEIIYSN